MGKKVDYTEAAHKELLVCQKELSKFASAAVVAKPKKGEKEEAVFTTTEGLESLCSSYLERVATAGRIPCVRASIEPLREIVMEAKAEDSFKASLIVLLDQYERAIPEDQPDCDLTARKLAVNVS